MSETGSSSIYGLEFTELAEITPEPGNEVSVRAATLEDAPPLPVGCEPYIEFAKENLGEFTDIALLMTAFTHRSYLNEHRGEVLDNNERLEFFGDAILEQSVTKFLFLNYKEPEGVLTGWRTALVRTESLTAAAKREGFEKLIRVSNGNRKNERAMNAILADCFEAVIAAVYLAEGQEAVDEFIARTVLVSFDEILRTGAWIDPKTRLQEVAQRTDGHTPVYGVLSKAGPDHEKEFTVGVFVDGVEKGQGVGHNLKTAQANAAINALITYV